MNKETFFPAIKAFMNVPPEEFIQGLNKLFIMVASLSFKEALAAYQTIDLILELRSEELQSQEFKALFFLKDKAIFARLSSFVYDFSCNHEDSVKLAKYIKQAIGKNVSHYNL